MPTIVGRKISSYQPSYIYVSKPGAQWSTGVGLYQLRSSQSEKNQLPRKLGKSLRKLGSQNMKLENEESQLGN